MRAIVYYIYLSFLLLSGGNYLYGNIQDSAKSPSFVQKQGVKQQVKHKNSKHHSVLKESSDIELDEEFHLSDEHNNGENKILFNKQSLLDSWYLTFFRQNIFKDYSNNSKIVTPFGVHSNPIYLIIGVFRI